MQPTLKHNRRVAKLCLMRLPTVWIAPPYFKYSTVIQLELWNLEGLWSFNSVLAVPRRPHPKVFGVLSPTVPWTDPTYIVGECSYTAWETTARLWKSNIQAHYLLLLYVKTTVRGSSSTKQPCLKKTSGHVRLWFCINFCALRSKVCTGLSMPSTCKESTDSTIRFYQVRWKIL